MTNPSLQVTSIKQLAQNKTILCIFDNQYHSSITVYKNVCSLVNLIQTFDKIHVYLPNAGIGTPGMRINSVTLCQFRSY